MHTYTLFHFQRHKVITRLIQRYLIAMNKSKPQPHAPPGFEAESPSNNRQLRDLISQLQDVLQRNKDHKDSPEFIPTQPKVLKNNTLKNDVKNVSIFWHTSCH